MTMWNIEKIKLIASLPGFCLISLLAACAGSGPGTTPARDNGKIATMVEGTLSAIQTARLPSTPAADSLPTAAKIQIPDVWVWHYIELCDFQIQLPPGWVVNESARWREPVGPTYPTPDHDCAEYRVSNPDGTMQLFLIPECVVFEAGPDDCPNDIVLMSRQSEAVVHYFDIGDLIGRFYDGSKSAYIYVEVGFPLLREQISMACYMPANIVLKGETHMNFVRIEFRHPKFETDHDPILELADRIVFTLSKP